MSDLDAHQLHFGQTSRAKRPPLSMAVEVPFSQFNNKYTGRGCYVIGRGATDYNYDDLAAVIDPIFFLNDAVSLEPLTKSETFFFAHDSHMLPWFEGTLRSTAVVPIDGKLFNRPHTAPLNHAGPVVYYQWQRRIADSLLDLPRDHLAAAKTLYTNTGTIHSLLHFVWYCGFAKVGFIGCDGLDFNANSAATATPDGYDARLWNRSNSLSWGSYQQIRRQQDVLVKRFGLQATYLGTPR